MKRAFKKRGGIAPGSIPLSQIGFDFDGVIADTAQTFVAIAAKRYGYKSLSTEDITDFELEGCVAIPRETVERIFTEILHDSLGAEVLPMPSAIQTLSDFAARQQITVITARPLEQPVRDWLAHYLEPAIIHRFTVIATGDHDDKSRYIHEQGIEFFVDDRAATCLSLVEEGITPIVFRQPWNEGRHTFTTVDNWQEIATLVNLQG